MDFDGFKNKIEDRVYSQLDYTLDIVDLLLDTPIPGSTHCLTDEAGYFFYDTIAYYQRVPTDLPKSDSIYHGNWYYQGGEPTCLPWSIANATKALGARIQPEYLLALLKAATDNSNNKKPGMKFTTAIDLLQQYPHAGIQMTGAMDYRAFLTKTRTYTQLNIENLASSGIIGKIGTDTEYDLYIAYQKDKEVSIRHNAAIIKRSTDNSTPVLTSVNLQNYAQDKNRSLHAICIVGYRVSEDGCMDVQVIDSARGIIWMSLEHITDSVQPYDTYNLSH